MIDVCWNVHVLETDVGKVSLPELCRTVICGNASSELLR